MQGPDDDTEEDARDVTIQQPPTANPARTRVRPVNVGREPESDPMTGPTRVGEEG